VRLAVNVDSGGGVLVNVGMVHLLNGRGMGLHYLPALSIVQLHPVVLAVLNLASALERLSEEFAQVVVVRCILEAEVANVAQILVKLLCNLLTKRYYSNVIRCEHTREAVAEILNRGCLLLLADLLVLLLVGSSLQALPWQTASQEVHEDVTQSFQIVPTRLLTSQVSVDTHVTRRTGERLALSVWNVLLRLGVTVLLGHTEVDDVNYIGTLRAWSTNEEVVRLDVAVDEILLVDGLNPRQLEIC
jgi:hypothetical protein